MEWLLRILLEGILGYLLQNVAVVIGMYAMSRKRLELKPAMITTVASALFTMIVRNCGLFNFGVHTMLVLLAVNAMSVMICKLQVRYSILGSIVMIVCLLLGEVITVLAMSQIYPMDQIQIVLQEPITKAVWAIPGILVHLLVSSVLYYVRSIKKK